MRPGYPVRLEKAQPCDLARRLPYTAQDAAAAMDAGAQFIVAPDTDEAGIVANRSLETRQPITIKD